MIRLGIRFAYFLYVGYLVRDLQLRVEAHSVALSNCRQRRDAWRRRALKAESAITRTVQVPLTHMTAGAMRSDHWTSAMRNDFQQRLAAGAQEIERGLRRHPGLSGNA